MCAVAPRETIPGGLQVHACPLFLPVIHGHLAQLTLRTDPDDPGRKRGQRAQLHTLERVLTA